MVWMKWRVLGVAIYTAHISSSSKNKSMLSYALQLTRLFEKFCAFLIVLESTADTIWLSKRSRSFENAFAIPPVPIIPQLNVFLLFIFIIENTNQLEILDCKNFSFIAKKDCRFYLKWSFQKKLISVIYSFFLYWYFAYNGFSMANTLLSY